MFIFYTSLPLHYKISKIYARYTIKSTTLHYKNLGVTL